MFNRALQASTRTRQTSGTKIFPAPNKGWIRNDSIATPKPGGAEVMDNWFPTPEGCRMRKGSIKHATIDAAVTHLTAYTSGAGKFYACDATSIYDITTPASASVAPTADITGKTSGDWSSVMFSAGGGDYLVMVNGADDMEQYTGSAWRTVDAASTPAITGVDTADLSHVWPFKSRLFFIEGGTMSAWYLDVLSVTGAATELPLGSVFREGGALLFGATWSLDSGDGLDDVCLFITDKGEIAVYEGSDPSDANAWSMVGVYRIGKPLHKNAWFRAGGDIAVVTDDGVVPVSAAVKTDRAALKGQAVTYPIEEAWRQLVARRGAGAIPFSVCLWHSTAMLVVGVPTYGSFDAYCLVANARTGAWARYTGWDTRCVFVFRDDLYFGTADGTIVQGEIGGADQGASYQAVLVPRFDMLNAPGEKSAVSVRMLARSNNAFTPQLFASADYSVDLPTPIASDPDENANLWDTGVWGSSTWSVTSETKARRSEWQTVSANGQALAPGLQVSSGRTTAPDIELISLHLQYEVGEVMG